MRFFTVPDIYNQPIMVNIDHIESLTYNEEDYNIININLSSTRTIQTSMPREILVGMINRVSTKPETVTTHTEFAG